MNEAASLPPSSSFVERLVQELGRRWRAGECPAVEEYLAHFPELAKHTETAVELIYEELCLRQERGQEGAEADVLRRFPQWQKQLQVLIECHRLFEAEPVAPRFPVPGESLGDFRLLAEIGRGAQGRVFLATQPALSDRPVVLKLVPRSCQEHLSLARLQHTYIVPLYSVQDDPARDLRALCMPYFGGATLARVLELLHGRQPGQRSGQHIVEALRQAQAAAPLGLPIEGPACRFLVRASYTRAVCWLGLCLAEALQYTHERGLVHLDLKPSNVLWGADGQPMLLDLHLAREPVVPGAAAPVWLGGTPAYMAPEHRLALAAVREGRSVSVAVDGRADLYALGLVLCEALAGALPPAAASAARWLRQRNPQVTVGLADILGKCLADAPGARYRDAAALGDDLRRHLADQPLRGAGNRSLGERWRKWRRRQPLRLFAFGLALVLLAGAALALAYIAHEAHKARAALAEGQEHLHKREYAAARAAWQRGLATAEGLPFHRDLADELRGQLLLAQRAEAAQELHFIVEWLRSLYGADGYSPGEMRAVEALCRSFWARRDQIARQLGAHEVPEHEQVQIDLLDLAILWTDLRVRLAGPGEVRAVRQAALEVLTQAEALFGPSCVLDYERQTHAAALGRAAPQPKAVIGPRTAWEHFALGRAHFRAGDLEAAAAELDQALALDPQALWPHFYKGKCAYQRGQHEDAVLAFSACVVLAPDRAWCYANRGLAYEALGQVDRALRDYDRALQLDPTLAMAAVNRDRLQSKL
jgi:serine/threonine protein kinase